MCNAPIIDNHTYNDIDEDLLIDESYTISYYHQIKTWFSFHDYIPDLMTSLRDNKVISIKNNCLYYHNQDFIYCSFYNNQIYESYITPTISTNLKETETSRKLSLWLQNVNWNADVKDKDKRLLNETFSYISIHNSFQGTVKRKLVNYDESCSHLENFGNYNVRRIHNRWEFNKFKDDILNSDFNSFYTTIMDLRESNAVSENCEKEHIKNLIDDWFLIKLTYDNLKQRSIQFYELNFTYKPVMR